MAAVQQQLDTIQTTLDKGFAANQEKLNLLTHLTQENAADLIHWLAVAFQIRQVQELENFAELEAIFKDAKKASGSSTKFLTV